MNGGLKNECVRFHKAKGTTYSSGKLSYKQGESIFFASYSYILHGMLVISNACTHNFLQNA